MKRASTLYSLALLAAGILIGSPATGLAQFPRVVLIEEFTSVTCKPCTTATPILNDAVSKSGGRVLSIRYHLNFPSPGDPWYNANRPHNDARKAFYAVPSLPYGRLDGATTVSVTEEGDVQDKVSDRLEQESPVKLEVTQTRNGDQINVQVKATAGDNGLDGSNFKLHVVAVESHIHDDRYQNEPFNKEKEFFDVMRTMIPGPDGTEISLMPNETKTLDFSYTLGQGWQANQMYTVAFVQNDVSKLVLQAGNSVRPPQLGVPSISEAMAGYALEQNVPNPARDAASVRYTLGAREHVTIELYNVTGELVKSFDEGVRERGEHGMMIDLRELPAGSYTYALRAGAYHAAGKMTVVK